MTECHAGLSEATDIDTFDLVPFANVSAPAWLLEELGGFDEGFTEYGFEEYDLGARLLEQGVRIRFEPDATAWHYTTATDPELIRHRNRAAGRNAVRFVRRHPACADRVFGSKAAWRAMRLFGRLGLTSSGSLDAVSTASALVGRVVALFVRGSYRPHRFSWAAAFAAGVADLDEQQEFLPLLLSRPGLARPRHQRRR
jgi:GT2 family glycosyltransferase